MSEPRYDQDHSDPSEYDDPDGPFEAVDDAGVLNRFATHAEAVRWLLQQLSDAPMDRTWINTRGFAS